MHVIGSDQRIIGICKEAVRPLIDDWVDDLRAAAGKPDAERTRIMDACDERLRRHMNAIADEHHMDARLRGQFFAAALDLQEEAARKSLETIRRNMNQPQVIVVRQSQGCLPIIIASMAVGALLLI